jgi:organic radical activating enzyme
MNKVLNLKDNLGELHVSKKENGYYNLIRKNNRNKIINVIDHVQFFNSNNECKLIPIDDRILKEIEYKIETNSNYSSYFVFHDTLDKIDDKYVNQEKSQEEHQFTSTGIKFWRHQEKMLNYKNGNSHTVVSTHISPEGACNLKCPYCSVTYRKNSSRIELDVIKDYVIKLKSRGLKAVILTGGGEPTMYKHFNELIRWLKEQNLSVALITNGTNARLVNDDVWGMFSWVRVSVNLFDEWESKINIPIKFLSDECILGMSHVFTVEHEKIESTEVLEYFDKISKLADRLNAKYIRVLPNCLLEQETLVRVHRGLDVVFTKLKDPRFFHQYKFHEAPKSKVCHQSYFRPYLSEEPFHATGIPGTVYPCDSVVLNSSVTHFAQKYQLCGASDILEYIDKKISHKFIPCEDCKGCVFTNNINTIDDFINNKIDRFDEFTKPIKHEEFI